MSDTVTLAYVHDGKDVAFSFYDSIKQLLFYDAANEMRIMRGGELKMRCGSGALPEARNQAVEGFLKDPADWFMWIDTDMGFAPDSLERLLEAADPVTAPIVGGLCFALKEVKPDGMGGYRTSARPTISDWVHDDVNNRVGFMGRGWYPPDTLVQCQGTGAAFILIHRTVLERVRDECGTWFTRIPNGDGELVSEDLSFCIRAGSLGFPVHVHTGVKTTHMKSVWLSEADFWDQQQPPPATEEVAVVVPVMRAECAEPFMRSLRASTGLATAYAMTSAGETDLIKAWEAAGARVIVCEADHPTSFGHRVNEGFKHTPEPWLFVTGEDVRFHPGWLDHAQHAARCGDASVIGTNDLANERVMRGEHAVHLLIRRSYIDEHGASWDGPGVVCHEGYRHWFVDDEIVNAAKQRDTWAMALGSKVEHLHPLVGKAEMDDVYRIGSKHADTDRKLFKGRQKAFG